ncbi:Uma2 family endonuclease [Dactylosporangium sp. CA-233914]|uniref:Uma2 family endonuclease n=1 Tax=Dactylosporangium sp. CA-233914 TaxID=3239934 RepID=UPI003D911583
MPSPDFEHAVIATRIMLWLAAAGWPAEKITQAVALRIPGSGGGVGGRIPDLVVWGKVPAQPRTVWLPVDGVLLVVEIVSSGSEAADTVTKRVEYAGAGIVQYWTVGRDASQTVTMYRLAHDAYQTRAAMPLAWVLNATPANYLDCETTPSASGEWSGST